MKLPWKRRADPPQFGAAPEGVRIVWEDGTVIACDVLRDPDQDESGCAAWIAVPRDPMPVATGGFVVRADVLHPKTVLKLEFRA
jgi:hypothetical protein